MVYDIFLLLHYLPADVPFGTRKPNCRISWGENGVLGFLPSLRSVAYVEQSRSHISHGWEKNSKKDRECSGRTPRSVKAQCEVFCLWDPYLCITLRVLHNIYSTISWVIHNIYFMLQIQAYSGRCCCLWEGKAYSLTADKLCCKGKTCLSSGWESPGYVKQSKRCLIERACVYSWLQNFVIIFIFK